MRRRDALIIGGAFAVAITIPPILRHCNDDLVFSEVPGMPGFRHLKRGNISAGPDMFPGLRTPEETAADARSDQMTRTIENALALGRALGIPGTPGVMIGRTLVIGALPEATLAQVIALEQQTPFTGCR